MIIGTTDQLLTIVIVTAIGGVIAFIITRFKKKKYRYVAGGVVALAFGALIVYRGIESLQQGSVGGVVACVLLTLFIIFLALSLFVNAKKAG